MSDLINFAKDAAILVVNVWVICVAVALLRHDYKTGRIIGLFELVGIIWRGDFKVKP